MQAVISELLVAEAELAVMQNNFDNYIKELVDMAELLEAKSGLNADLLTLKYDNRTAITTLNAFIQTLKTLSGTLQFAAEIVKEVKEAGDAAPQVTAGTSNNVSGPVRAAIRLAMMSRDP